MAYTDAMSAIAATPTVAVDHHLDRDGIDDLADAIAIASARIDAATHGLLTLVRRFDQAKGWAAQNAGSCAHWRVPRRLQKEVMKMTT